MKLSKVVGLFCFLAAFNILIWLLVPEFVIINDYSYYYEKIKLNGMEVFQTSGFLSVSRCTKYGTNALPVFF